MKGLLIASSIIASSIGLGLASGPASAADIPAKAAPGVGASTPPAQTYTWTGCYINGGAGYGMWKQNHYGEELKPLEPLTPTVSTGSEGWIGTVGVGCDYQAGPRWLIGAFGDYNLMTPVYGGVFQEPYLGWIGNETEQAAWVVGGRIGFLVTPKLLTYVSAGYNQARSGQINLLSDTQAVPATCGAGPCFIPAHSDGGWFIGGGTEYALPDIIPVRGLFWRIDYRYARYNSANLPILTTTGAPVTCIAAIACGEHMQQDVQTVTTGLVWRFNVDGPLSGSPLAADIPAAAAPGVGAPPPPAQTYSWTGCYINGGAGYGMWEQDSSLTSSSGGEGWVGTVGLGCDYQAASRWLIGALADYDFMNLSGSFKDPFVGYIGNQTASAAWAIGARIGFLVTPKLLTYINIGYPFVHFDQINLLASPYFYPAHTSTHSCCFFGGGTEFALGDIMPLEGLFWRIEYRYDESGGACLPLLTATGSSTSLGTPCLQVNRDVQTITSGFVWRFNFGGS